MRQLRVDQTPTGASPPCRDRLTLSDALLAAVDGWLTDDRDLESPLAVARGLRGPGACSRLADGDAVRCYLNSPGSSVAVVEPGGMDRAAAPAWHLALHMPEASDHVYRAVVPCDGKEVIVTGFN